MASMKTRVLTAAVALPVIILLLVLGQWNFWFISAAVAGASAFMMCELLTAKEFIKDYKIAIPCVLFCLICPLVSYMRFILVAFYLFMLCMFLIMVLNHKSISFYELAFCLTGATVINIGMSCITRLCAQNDAFASFFMVVCLAVPWMSDAGGYFAGTFFGRHKLCPEISPKKTVEGFFGGVVFCIAGALLTGFVFQSFFYPAAQINYLSLSLIGVLASLTAVLGDLSFSLIKRSCHIKDYGSIFPGHGGMLDRCDSVIFTAPLILIIHQFIPVIL